MQNDELEAVWKRHGAMLERSLAIDERILSELLMKKVRRTLTPYALFRALEVVCGVVALVVFAPIVFRHRAEPVYLVLGGSVLLHATGFVAFAFDLLRRSLRIDYGGSVTAIQGEVERLRLVESRSFLWAILGGVATWHTTALLVFEALSGADVLARVARESGVWLWANVGVGLALLWCGRLWSKRYLERTDGPPWARRVMDALTGRAILRARLRLDDLARFLKDAPR